VVTAEAVQRLLRKIVVVHEFASRCEIWGMLACGRPSQQRKVALCMPSSVIHAVTIQASRESGANRC
jgi:hypothetical protein